MSIAAGLVGLPNVGKSTLFNALTNSQVPAANYPFCTIDPHLACTEVPDQRTEKLKALYKSGKIIGSTVQFVDIAGLVKGASQGEGLGNQFLSHIREVDLILHVLRCFDDSEITHTHGSIDPLFDYEIITNELMLKDLDSVAKRKLKIAQLLKSSKNNPAQIKELELESKFLETLEPLLNKGDIIAVQELFAQTPESILKATSLLSSKKFMIIANISEHEVADNAYEKNKHYQTLIAKFGKDRVIPVSAKLEYDLSQLPQTEAQEMAEMYGLKQRGLDSVIASTYKNLGLITFFTCGPKEIHAWPIRKGINVRSAAGEIHSDLEKGFICAEVFNCEDLFTYGSEVKLKEAGKIRTEGQDYIVKDGDILNIRFNV